MHLDWTRPKTAFRKKDEKLGKMWLRITTHLYLFCLQIPDTLQKDKKWDFQTT